MRWNNICLVENNTKETGFSLGRLHMGDSPASYGGTSARGQIINGETCTTASDPHVMDWSTNYMLCKAYCVIHHTDKILKNCSKCLHIIDFATIYILAIT